MVGGAGTSGLAPTLSFDIGLTGGSNDLLALTRNATVNASGGKIGINVVGGNVTAPR